MNEPAQATRTTRSHIKLLFILNIITLSALIIMSAILYTTWFQLQLVDQGSTSDINHLSNDIANQRECLKKEDKDCRPGKYIPR